MNELELILGSTSDFTIDIVDEDAEAESLSGATDARVTIRDSLGGTVIAERSLSKATLSLNLSDAKLVCTALPTTVPAGLYVGDAMIYIGSSWWACKPFRVRVREAATRGHLARVESGGFSCRLSMPSATVVIT